MALSWVVLPRCCSLYIICSDFLASGGKRFISEADLGYDLCGLAIAADTAFFENPFGTIYVGDDAETYVVDGSGCLFDDIGRIGFFTPDGIDAHYADQSAALDGGLEVMRYVGGNGGSAAVQYDNVVSFGFPFETFDSSSDRLDVMTCILDHFELR